MITWRERLRMNEDLRDIDKWGMIDIDAIPDDKIDAFLRNREIVEAAIGGSHGNEVAAALGVHPSKVSALLKRCLESKDDEEPALLAGLVPHYRVNGYNRTKKIEKSSGSLGKAGAFQWLLDHVEGLQAHLDEMILADLRDRKSAEKLTVRGLHWAFLRFLRKRGFRDHQYPFNIKTKGKNSVRRYFRRRRIELAKYRSEAGDKRVNESKAYKDALVPFDEAEFDEHLTDVFTHLPVSLAASIIQILRLPRIWLLAGIDRASTACLTYTYGLTSQIGQLDFLACIDSLTRVWEPMELTIPGLKYLPDAGFPSGVIEECRQALPRVIRTDNAWAHYSLQVQNALTDKYGIIHNRGRKASPLSRPGVERLFGVLESYLHRLPSTAGTGPQDPTRESPKNAKEPPVLSIYHLQELIDVSLANYNATPRPDLFNRSPNQVIKDGVAAGHIPMRTAPHYRKAGGLFVRYDKVIVQGRPDQGVSPHINFLYGRYRGHPINNPTLIGKTVTIRYDYRDLRVLTVIGENGQIIGEVRVQGHRSRRAYTEGEAREHGQKAQEHRANCYDTDTAGVYMEAVNNGQLPPKKALEVFRDEVTSENTESEQHSTGESSSDGSLEHSTLWRPRTTWDNDD